MENKVRDCFCWAAVKAVQKINIKKNNNEELCFIDHLLYIKPFIQPFTFFISSSE